MLLVFITLIACHLDSHVLRASPICDSRAEGAENQVSEHFGSLLQTSQSRQRQSEVSVSAPMFETSSQWFWEGEDLTEDEHDIDLPQLFFNSSHPPNSSSSVPKYGVRVAGMFGSGTHLMQAFLKFNFGEKIFNGAVSEDLCSRKEPWTFGDTVTQVPCGDFWKHTHPFRIQYFDEQAFRARPIAIVAMVRNPISQLASWKKHPFNLYQCSVNSTSCTCDERKDSPEGKEKFCPCGDNTKVELCQGRGCNFGPPPSGSCFRAGKPYANLVSVWNSYTSGYKFLQDADNVPVKVIVVTYEALVNNPEAMLATLATALGAETSSETTTVIGESLRYDGEDRGRALERMESKTYRDEFAEDELRRICSQLDKTLLADFGYAGECT